MTALPLNLPRESADQRTVAERKWQVSGRTDKPQKPMDIGLFSDDRDQLEMLTTTRKDRPWAQTP